MRIPSQTVQSEDDAEKSNHEKDPIFKDDTSKGTASLLCLTFIHADHVKTSTIILNHSIYS